MVRQVLGLGNAVFELLERAADEALRRATTEQAIYDMISVERGAFDEALARYRAGQYAFILQQGHLTRREGDASSASILEDAYEYGITFIPKPYIEAGGTAWQFAVWPARQGAQAPQLIWNGTTTR